MISLYRQLFKSVENYQKGVLEFCWKPHFVQRGSKRTKDGTSLLETFTGRYLSDYATNFYTRLNRSPSLLAKYRLKNRWKWRQNIKTLSKIYCVCKNSSPRKFTLAKLSTNKVLYRQILLIRIRKLRNLCFKKECKVF